MPQDAVTCACLSSGVHKASPHQMDSVHVFNAPETWVVVVWSPATGPKQLPGVWGMAHLVDSVRPVLGFQAESRVLGVCNSAFAPQGAIQVVPSVKLDARLGGVNFHGPASGWVASPGEMPVEDVKGLAKWAPRDSRGGGPLPGSQPTWPRGIEPAPAAGRSCGRSHPGETSASASPAPRAAGDQSWCPARRPPPLGKENSSVSHSLTCQQIPVAPAAVQG